MNTNNLVSLLLAVAVVLLSVKVLFFSKQNQPTMETTQTATSSVDSTSIALDNIYTRTSIRSYTDEKVSDAQVETLLRAAMSAPTAGNRQPWRFIVVNERARLDAFTDVARGMSMASQAPLAIIVCGDVDATFEGEGREYWAQDASAATENLLLAAHAMGLGAVWCGVYPMSDRLPKIKEMFALPDNILPLNVIFIGHPAENPAPKDKWKPENVHYNQW